METILSLVQYIRLFSLWIFIVTVSCPAFPQENRDPYLILVSFDGFRHDYVDKFDLPNFKSFIRDGAQAEGLIPCYPSMTFPNHYSIATGLYPGNHGLVDNSFFDRELNALYTMRDRSKVTDPAFYGGKPIWRLAKEAGIKTASYFWVGSEVSSQELRPDFYYEYDGSVSFSARVEKVIAWLSLPEKERPHLITLYFSSPDWEAHMYGPWAQRTKDAVLQADSLLGYLMNRVKNTGLPVNVLLTSDHGLTEITVSKDTYVYLDRIINVEDTTYRLVNNGTHAHVYTESKETTDSLFRILKIHEGRYRVFRKEEIPESWHYDHPRVGDIFIQAIHPHYMRNKAGGFLRDGKPGTVRGVHGYDPTVLWDMHGIFYANGPNIRKGGRLKRIRNIDVYPLMAQILKLKSPPIDGSPEEISKLYKTR